MNLTGNIQLKQLCIHQVGNQTIGEELIYSQSPANIEDPELVQILHTYFLSHFSGNEMYRFQNDVSLEQNEIYVLCRRIFENPQTLSDHSQTIALHLFNKSQHPKIKGGELYVAYFENLEFRGHRIAAIGLFKSESRDNFIQVNLNKGADSLNYAEGTNVNKLDKGCLILNLEAEEGYQVCIIDTLNKATEAVYWKDDFLNISPLKNEFHQTRQFMGMTKEFVTKQLNKDFEVSKADQIDLLNRSVDYFKKNETFEQKDFEEKVFSDTELIKSFRKFDNQYQEENNMEFSDSFEISKDAVKKQARNFKSILKLDKNFHIYIHGNRDLIEQGTEDDGRKYYKIYYKEEA